jgi:tetratricopeptide (TPR) repeat protein
LNGKQGVTALYTPHYIALSHKQQLGVGALLFASLLIAAHVFWPGLSGFFIFDDFVNLEGLANISDSPTPIQFIQYIGGGISSTLGRPVSLASFAMQHYLWPHQPGGFKYVNLMIHLLNGVLIFWLTFKLLTIANREQTRAPIIAITAALVWLVHPLQVSTVLYVVQRMAELSALFTLVTLIAYLYGRQLAVSHSTASGYLVMSAAMVIGLPLAILSKENGILIPLLLWVIEVTLLNRVENPRNWFTWAGVFIAIPLILLLGYLIFVTPFWHGYGARPFSFNERLLTEVRILTDYLTKFIFPNPSRFGMFFDDFTLSTNLTTPWSTLPAVAFITSLISSAVLLRKHFPVAAFAVLWFFCAHLLESSVIPLELYFEHRNYLPLMGPSIGLAYYTIKVIGSFNTRSAKIMASVLGVILLALIALITRHESALWGQPVMQAKIWAQERPHSKRIQARYASMLTTQKKYLEAANIYRKIFDSDPRDIAPLVFLTELGCYDVAHELPKLDTLLPKLRSGDQYQHATFNSLDTIFNLKESNQCNHVDMSYLIAMVDALLENSGYQRHKHTLYFLKGRAYTVLGKKEKALHWFARGYDISPRIEVLLNMIKLAAETDQLEQAKEYIRLAKNDNRISVLQRTIYAQRIRGLENAVAILEKISKSLS